MSDKVQIYPPEGTLDQLSITCQGDEDVFRAKLTKLVRVDAGTQATYQPVPFEQPYVKKALTFVDLAHASPQPPGTDVLFQSAEVFLNSNPAQVAVYREK
ncbi:MAG TPA: hypothetical protein DC054_20485 [Blastocatellia bacterium]|nr:hypothetical protein [Blastocatellia bacterium]